MAALKVYQAKHLHDMDKPGPDPVMFKQLRSATNSAPHAAKARGQFTYLLSRSFPTEHSESGFYSCYFHVPKKDGGLRPILDLRCLNRTLSSPWGLVYIGGTKRHFHIQTDPPILDNWLHLAQTRQELKLTDYCSSVI